MLQIKNTLGGSKPEGLYVWKKSLFELGDLQNFNKSLSTISYYFSRGSAVILNNKVHILGSSYDSLYYKKHSMWNGESWTSVSTLPYDFYGGSAVVLNGEIHILSGSGGSTNHYKWDGASWTSVSTLPVALTSGSAVVLNGEIHILGGSNSQTKHYKFDGTSWTSVSTLPYNFYEGSAVVLNGEIHILGGSGHGTNHYKYDGISWTSVSTLPYNFYGGSAVVHKNTIQILGGISGTRYHYSIVGYTPTYTFLNYVVSDKETAYPDGGEKDGYWYEKYKAIVKKVTGSFRGSYQTSSYTINHNGNMDVIGVRSSGSSGSYSLGMAIVGSDEIGFIGFEANGNGNAYSPSLKIIDENTCEITYGNSYGPGNSTVNYYIYGIARE